MPNEQSSKIEYFAFLLLVQLVVHPHSVNADILSSMEYQYLGNARTLSQLYLYMNVGVKQSQRCHFTLLGSSPTVLTSIAFPCRLSASLGQWLTAFDALRYTNLLAAKKRLIIISLMILLKHLSSKDLIHGDCSLSNILMIGHVLPMLIDANTLVSVPSGTDKVLIKTRVATWPDYALDECTQTKNSDLFSVCFHLALYFLLSDEKDQMQITTMYCMMKKELDLQTNTRLWVLSRSDYQTLRFNNYLSFYGVLQKRHFSENIKPMLPYILSFINPVMNDRHCLDDFLSDNFILSQAANDVRDLIVHYPDDFEKKE